MSGRKWFLLSLVANAALVGVLFLHAPSPVPESPGTASRPDLTGATVTGRTQVVVRRQNFTWQEVESDDYVTYINNLRDIGVPEQTIRDIIVADVNQLYSHKRSTEVVSADHQWWRADPDMDVNEQAMQKMQSLDAERRALLTRLLGPTWESVAAAVPPPVRTGVSLSGPVLGELPTETKQKIYDVTARAQQKMDAYMQNQTQAGAAVDPVELARIRQQTRTELSQILTPPQLEEFLLRYSKTAQDLREELHGVELSPEQFRALFHARDPLDQQLELSLTGNSAGAMRERQAVEAKREAAMRQVLGPELYQNYKLNQDPGFQATKAVAQQVGVPEKTIAPVYRVSEASDLERARILADVNLSEEQRNAALAAVESEEQKSLEKILGNEMAQRFLRERNQ